MSYYARIEVGVRRELGSHTFAAEDIVRFATKFDPQPFHLSEAGAAASHFGRLCASGWHTAAVFMKLSTRARERDVEAWIGAGNPPPLLGPSPGFENLRWLKPVYAGDTLTYFSTCTGKRELRSRPGWGMVDAANQAVNQDGATVFSFDGHVMVGL